MKTKVRYIISATVLLLFGILGLVLLTISRKEMAILTCESVEICMKDSLRFVTAEEVRSYLDSNYPGIIGERLDSLKLSRIEEMILSRSSIRDCQAWTDASGVLHIVVGQRLPAMRFGDSQNGFYVDETGFIFPLHRNYTADVPHVGGAVPVREGPGFKGEARTEEGRRWIAAMLDFQKYVDKSREWKGKIADTRIDDNGDLVFRTSRGTETVIFGKPYGLAEKFDKMNKYFGRIKPQAADKEYKSISVKYNNQIICRNDM